MRSTLRNRDKEGGILRVRLYMRMGGWVRAACVHIHTYISVSDKRRTGNRERDREPYWPVGVARLQEDGNNREFVRYHAFLTHL